MYYIMCSPCQPLADTHLQLLAEVFYSVVNGFHLYGRPNQLKCKFKLGTCFDFGCSLR